jgi:type IV pilus assembly protein PilB
MDADTSAVYHLLLDNGIATEGQLDEVCEEHARTGKSFVQAVYNFGIISEEDLLQMIAEHLATEVVDLTEVELPARIREKVSASLARMYGIIPVREEDGALVIAAKDPLNYRMLDELHYVLGQPKQLDEALDLIYPEQVESVADVLNELASAGMDTFGADQDLNDEDALKEMATNAPIVRFVDIVLYQAIKDQASDIHFEPFADEFRIRYRIDGTLYEMAPPPKHLSVPVISRIKVMSGLNIAERRHPQDGRIEMRIAGKLIDLRVSTLPTQYGESVVLRVLDRTVVDLNLDKLGIAEDTLRVLREIIHRPNGIVIVTGPTGCGKTTTLYSCLKEVNDIGEKLLTAEDPVEYDLEGIMQLQVRDAIGNTFANALRAFLRQDPDRIMVGEIRDVETASMAIQASLTGHLVLSTLHTNDAPGAITRLIDMGVEAFLISSTLCAVLAQRLVRCVCPQCKAPYEPDDEELKALGVTREELGEVQFYSGRGCPNCNNTGYRGRTGIFEFLRITPAVQDMINLRTPTSEIRREALKEGMVSMRRSGIRAVMDGLTTAEEVLKYT